ncbi:hypothetical protein Pssp01_53970 [Pseudomonas sp. NBRC 100443]|nr:hypothetical protein Pssp01_53970 [Pseudomonas sp. NBRC 100443]
MDFLFGQADPFGVTLDDQQRQQDADKRGPAEKTQGLQHRRTILGGLLGLGKAARVAAIIRAAWQENSRLP